MLPEPLIHRQGRVIPGQFAGEIQGDELKPFEAILNSMTRAERKAPKRSKGRLPRKLRQRGDRREAQVRHFRFGCYRPLVQEAAGEHIVGGVDGPDVLFGDKAGDVKDASMKAPPSTKGVVIDKKLFSRAGRRIQDYVTLVPVDPNTRVHFWDGTFRFTRIGTGSLGGKASGLAFIKEALAKDFDFAGPARQGQVNVLQGHGRGSHCIEHGFPYADCRGPDA